MHESETRFAPCNNTFPLVLTSSPTLKNVLVSGLKQNTRPKKCAFDSERGEEMGHAPFWLHPSRIGHECSDTAVLKETSQQFVEHWENSEWEALGSAMDQSVTEGLSNVHPHSISNGKILNATRDGLSRIWQELEGEPWERSVLSDGGWAELEGEPLSSSVLLGAPCFLTVSYRFLMVQHLLTCRRHLINILIICHEK